MTKLQKNLILLLYFILAMLCIIGMALCNLSRDVTIVSVLSFTSIVAASLLLSWSAETAQFMISQGLAIAIIAILQILPEFFVEAVIAWNKNISLMLANFTGSNRLLMGLGWPSIFFIYYYVNYIKHRKRPPRDISLKKEHILEILTLFAGCLYFIKILLTNKITVFDAFVFLLIFIYYFWALSKLPPEHEENIKDLFAPAKVLAENKNKKNKIIYVAILLIISGVTFIFVTHPFLESMKHLSVFLGVSTFLFVQWIAPFLTEFPEKLTSYYWASRMRLAPMGLLNMISSSVNQWTLLVAMVPIVYSLSSRALMHIPLDAQLNHEVLLTVIMTFYGVVCLSKFKLTRANAMVIFSFWLAQFLFPETRLHVAAAFLFFTVVEIIIHYKDITLIDAAKKTFAQIYK